MRPWGPYRTPHATHRGQTHTRGVVAWVYPLLCLLFLWAYPLPLAAQFEGGVGPVPLEDPEALHAWGNRMRDREGCTLAESAWLRVVADNPQSEWSPPSLYNLAVCREFDQEWAQALAYYERLIAEYPEDPLIKDARFRKGLVLEEMGEYRASKRVFRAMKRDARALKLSPGDYLAADIVLDIERMKSGQVRRGSKAILAHLEGYQNMEREAQEPLSFWMAKAELALGQVLSENANGIPLYLTGIKGLRGRMPWNSEQDMLIEQLNERGRDLLAAQSRYQATIDYQQPIWTLSAIYHMGRDYEILYRDMVDAPPPRGLDPEAEEAYLHGVADKAWPILIKAYRLYVYGDDLGRSFDVKTHHKTLLEERRRALDLEGVTSEGGAYEPPPEIDPDGL